MNPASRETADLIHAPSTGLGWIERGRVPCLDGLRAVSILLVLLAHASETHGFRAPRLVSVIARGGSIGVDVFFVISGFLITLLLMREISRTDSVSIPDFYRRRALRILPAYIAYCLVVLCLTQSHQLHLHRGDWPAVLTYTVNFLHKPNWVVGHIWSLSIEEQFYLLWPLTLLLAGPKRGRSIVIGCLLAAPALRVAVYLFDKPDLLYVDGWTPTRIDSIAAGCLLALLAHSPALHRMGVRCRSRLTPILLGACALLILSIIGRRFSIYTMALGYTVNAACIAAILWFCATNADTTFGRFLQSRILTAVGVLSYSLYLWQQLFLNPYNSSWPARWPVNILLAVAAASVSYLAIEAPFLRLKARSHQTRAQSAITASATA